MQPATLGGLFLIDFLLFPHAADSAAKSGADVQGHCPPYWNLAADAYTAYESHLGYNTFVREYYLFLRLLAERIYTARLPTGQIRDAADFHAWLEELSKIAEQSDSLAEFFKQI